MSESPWLPQFSWRIALTAVVLVLAVDLWGFGAHFFGKTVPAEHLNGSAGFAITPPGGWTQRIDDPEGSRIAPEEQPAQGYAWMVVTTRLSTGDSPSLLLTEIKARPAGGPVRDLEWQAERPFTFDDGSTGVVAEFDQRLHGREISGWTVITVRGARMFQISAVAPNYAREAWTPGIEAAMASLRVLN